MTFWKAGSFVVIVGTLSHTFFENACIRQNSGGSMTNRSKCPRHKRLSNTNIFFKNKMKAEWWLTSYGLIRTHNCCFNWNFGFAKGVYFWSLCFAASTCTAFAVFLFSFGRLYGNPAKLDEQPGYCKDCGDGKGADRVMCEWESVLPQNNTYPDAVDCDKSRNQLVLGSCIIGSVLSILRRMLLTEKDKSYKWLGCMNMHH